MRNTTGTTTKGELRRLFDLTIQYASESEVVRPEEISTNNVSNPVLEQLLAAESELKRANPTNSFYDNWQQAVIRKLCTIVDGRVYLKPIDMTKLRMLKGKRLVYQVVLPNLDEAFKNLELYGSFGNLAKDYPTFLYPRRPDLTEEGLVVPSKTEEYKITLFID